MKKNGKNIKLKMVFYAQYMRKIMMKEKKNRMINNE